tara:strand:+ start:186 stop:1250 length:1065 start_codon:yes stop_codon:yes gene_type:complete
MPPYSSELQMKIAANLAFRKHALKNEESDGKVEKAVEEMSEDEVSEIMTDIVEDDRASDSTMEAIEELQEYAAKSEEAGDAAEELSDALAQVVVKNNEGSDDEKVAQAIMAVEWLKRASAAANVPPSEQKSSPKETEAGPRKSEGYAATAALPSKKVDAVAADTTEVQKVSQVQSAIDLLRKLAENDANPHPQNPGDKEKENMGPVKENPVKKVDGTGDAGMTAVMPLSAAAESSSGADMEVLAYLVQKTASEVGHFLPSYLAPSDKLAALRTMVGMNGPERAAYIGRIKEAAEGKGDSFLQTEVHEKKQNEQLKDLKKEVNSLQKNSPHSKVESAEDEEKKAALILRRLGIGA